MVNGHIKHQPPWSHWGQWDQWGIVMMVSKGSQWSQRSPQGQWSLWSFFLPTIRFTQKNNCFKCDNSILSRPKLKRNISCIVVELEASSLPVEACLNRAPYFSGCTNMRWGSRWGFYGLHDPQIRLSQQLVLLCKGVLAAMRPSWGEVFFRKHNLARVHVL